MTKSNTDFIEKIIMDEIAGKNAAIHSYDKIIWTIRSGFLTLLFGIWGLVLKGAIEQSQPLDSLHPFF